MNELLAYKENNVIEAQNQINYKELMNRFLNYIDVSDNTLQTYRRCLKQFWLYIYDNGITNPTRDDILNWKEYLITNNKPNTVNLYLVSVKNFFKWLEYEEITKDITKNIKSLRIEKRHIKRGLSKDEIDKVLYTCKNKREELLIKLMITCALRENEIVNIRLSDFYNDYGTVLLKVLGKGRDGQKSDIVKVDNRIYELIKEYCKEYDVKDYLFTSTSNNNKGGKLNTITIRRMVTGLFEKAGLEMDRLSTHSTRHTSCEMALESGMPIEEVSEMMRHSNINTTMVYTKEIKQRESKFANILADNLF